MRRWNRSKRRTGEEGGGGEGEGGEKERKKERKRGVGGDGGLEDWSSGGSEFLIKL